LSVERNPLPARPVTMGAKVGPAPWKNVLEMVWNYWI